MEIKEIEIFVSAQDIIAWVREKHGIKELPLKAIPVRDGDVFTGVSVEVNKKMLP